MLKYFQAFKKIDWILFFSAVSLTGAGLTEIYAICSASGNFFDFEKQLFFLIIGITSLFFISFFDYRSLRANPRILFILYLLGVLSLIGLLGTTPIRGSRGWYKFGLFSFDPVPFVILILIAVLSKYFSKYYTETYRLKHILFSLGYAILPAFFILIQPDFGSALMLLSVWLGIVLFSGIRLRHFLLLFAVSLIVFGFLWAFLLQDYQKQRVISFLNPNLDQRGISWNVNQSKIAIGAGGIIGQGIGKGTQTQYGFLPEAKTDFIFSAISEETGFLGVSVLFILFLILFWRIIKIAFWAGNNFARLFSLGFAFLILFQGSVNIAMSLGLLPVIGVPLPFVSYGGSQILAFYLGLGVLMSIKKHQSQKSYSEI